MERMTIKQLWKIAKQNNQPLLGTTVDLATLDFMEDYLTKIEAFDRDFSRDHGFFSYIEEYTEDYDTDYEYFQQWQKDVYYFLSKNEENYKRLYDLMHVAYDPLTNYDKQSSITDTESGSDKDTNVIGARHREENYAQKQNADNFGAVLHTENYGATTLTDSYGAVTETDIHGVKETSATDKIYGFNSSTGVNSESSITNEGQQQDTHSELAKSDTHTEAAKVDTHAENAKSDTHTIGAHKDEFDENQATDELTKTYGHKNVREELTKGNIGVTTSQQMAQSEIDLWNSFKFYDILFTDIIKNLCHFYSSGYDTF